MSRGAEAAARFSWILLPSLLVQFRTKDREKLWLGSICAVQGPELCSCESQILNDYITVPPHMKSTAQPQTALQQLYNSVQERVNKNV